MNVQERDEADEQVAGDVECTDQHPEQVDTPTRPGFRAPSGSRPVPAGGRVPFGEDDKGPFHEEALTNEELRIRFRMEKIFS